MDKKKNYIFLIIIVIILVFILNLLDNNDIQEESKNNDPIYRLVNDYSRFFTIDSCIFKYITFLSSGNVENVINVLDEDFIKTNNITTNNIYDYVDKLEGIYTFKTKKIYYEQGSKEVIKYYVYGNLIEEQMDEIGKEQDYYLIVNLDTKNQLFSIAPYDGTLFKEEN